MPVATTWNVLDMIRETSLVGVITVKWECRSSNDSRPEEAATFGQNSFTPDPSVPDFTPYDDLSEDQVIGWVKDALGPEKVTSYQTQSVTKVDEQNAKNSGKAEGVTWKSGTDPEAVPAPYPEP